MEYIEVGFVCVCVVFWVFWVFCGCCRLKLSIKAFYLESPARLTQTNTHTHKQKQGFKITDNAKLNKLKVDKEMLMARVCQAYNHQFFVDGFANCDPHAGNLSVSVREEVDPETGVCVCVCVCVCVNVGTQVVQQNREQTFNK
jgi:hypothetical protein